MPSALLSPPGSVGRAVPARQAAARAKCDPQSLIKDVRSRAAQLATATPRELIDRADDLRAILHNSRHFDADSDAQAAAFALVAEAAKRTLGIELYDVQLQAGLVLASESVAEMKTGEGKTYAAMLPAFLYSLASRGVHVATSNAYLAQRDCELLKPLYESLGATVGLVEADANSVEKQAAYSCDVTFAAGSEFGFDYLRDQVALRKLADRPLGSEFLRLLRGTASATRETLQRPLAASIVDEIDNVLIDDACSPLLLSMDSHRPAEDAAAHLAARQLADRLTEPDDILIDRVTCSVRLTEQGHSRAWENADNLPLKCLLRPWVSYIEQALRAKHFFRRDVHFVVQKQKVVIVDESTGRLFEERTWRDGLHQAIEAREGVPITAEKSSLARITRQRFSRLYDRLCGLTGTATGSEAEFRDVYRLSVSPIPTHRPDRRQLLPTRFFASGDTKWEAVALAVRDLHWTGRPVLIGTRSITASERIAATLTDAHLPFRLLNGVQTEDEATIIAQAGQTGAITIATNMAGRGTDIKPDAAALANGGLHVIATEHHDSHRVDRQLIGRTARQGDPGSAQFFSSADDDLLVRYGDWLRAEMLRLPNRSGEITTDLTKPMRRVQAHAEQTHDRQRRQLFLAEGQRDETLTRLMGDPT
ncbi:MAG: preprotein translocase subunit SecA [Planctomycetaceae bacterium]